MAYESIMQGLNEALDHAKGKEAGARVHDIELPVIDIAATRAQAGLSHSKKAGSITVAALAGGVTRRHHCRMAKRFDPHDFIIRLEAQILGIEPVISRTLELPRDLNFAQLHEVLQAAFGWTDSHLHRFIVGGLVIGAPEYLEEDAYGPRVIEATEVHLRDLRFPYGRDAQLEILYQYDFGDNWQHRLILSEVPPAEGVKYPRCIAGSRSCPPEDVGGDIGYEAFLEAWRDPDHEDHADNRRWAGRKFDPERFDLEATNRAITRALRLSRGDCRARQIESMALP